MLRISTFVLLFVFTGLAAAQDDMLPFFEETDCPFYVPSTETPGETIVCGYLIVPENRTTPDSPEIELAVAILASTNPNPPADPIIYLEGGPGGSALAGVDAWYASALRANRDLILFDQRGTGYSYPWLDCWELLEDMDDPVQACRDRLVNEEGVDLTAYNSSENASDINDLAVALGYDQVNLYGVSYGTRLALTTMRDHPDVLRSVIIDAVYPPHINSRETLALDAYSAFRTLFDNCAADADCSAAFPDLENVFYDTVDALNEAPAVVVDPESGDEYDLNGEDFVNAIFQWMYDGNAAVYMPAVIDAASQGDFTLYSDWQFLSQPEPTFEEEEAIALETERALMMALEIDDIDEFYEVIDAMSDDEYFELEAEALGLIDDDSEGMNFSVECYEEVPFNDIAAAEALAADVPIQIAEPMIIGSEQEAADCAVWNVPAAPAFENEPVVSDIPTIVMSGEYDPITPPSSGDAAVEYLENGVHLVFPTIGHGAVDVAPCPTEIAVAFFDDPTVEPDASCIDSMPGTVFYIP